MLLLLWVTLIAGGLTLYGIRPRPEAPAGPWPRWLWIAMAATFLSVIATMVVGIRWAGGPEHFRAARGGLVLTDSQVEGRTLFTQSCKRCHSLADVEAVSTVGPNLDRLDPSYELVLDAVVNGRRRGGGPMPRLVVDREQAKAVADYVSAVAGP